MPGREHPQQVVQRRADVAHVDLDVRERRCSQRDHDLTRAGGVGDALGQRQPRVGGIGYHAVEQRLRAGLLEGHPPFAHGVQAGGVVVDPDHLQAAVGERQGQRQPDAAEADDGHVGGAVCGAHRTPEVSGARAAGSRMRHAPGMRDAEMIVDVAEAESLAPEWDALAVAASKPFAAPAWVLAWWHHVAPSSSSPRLVVVRDSGRLVGVAPFYAQPRRRGVVEYRLMASDFGGSMEPLALPGREWDVAAEFARALASAQPRPDVLALGPMPIASAWPSALSAGWEGPMSPLVRRLRIAGAHVIVLDDGSYDAWFASLGSKLRRDLRRCERLFEEAGGSTRWSTAETLRADVEAFSRLHRGRWEGRGWSRLADMGARLPEWLEELGRGLIAQGRFRMCLLRSGDRRSAPTSSKRRR